MATTTNSSVYTFTISSTTSGDFQFYYQNVTDADAIALGNALRGFAWPASQGTVSVHISKLTDTATVSTADFTATPPAFS